MTAGEQVCSSTKKRPRRLLLLIFSTLAFIAGSWWWGMWGTAAHWYADRLANRERLLLADDWYERAETLSAHSSSLAFARARLSRKLARDDEFIEFLKVAIDRGLSSETARTEMMLAQAQRGDLAPLQSVLADLLVSGKDADEVCFAYVQGCLIKYQLDEALELLALWEADYPTDARPNLLRGRLMEHRVNLDGAQQEFQIALKKNSNYAAAAYNLARVLETEQKPGEAIPYYRQSARALKNSVPGLVGEARCLRLMQEYEKAKATLEKATQASNDSDVEAFRLMGDPAAGAEANLPMEQGYLAATIDDHVSAVNYLREAVEKNPHEWRARYQLALSQREIGELEAARNNFEIVDQTKEALATCDRLFDVLQQEPDNVNARLQIGQVFLQHLSENQGIVWLNSVLDLAPNHVAAHETLAAYYRSRAAENSEFAKLAAHHESFLPVPEK